MNAARFEALCRMLEASGDITPTGTRMLLAVVDSEIVQREARMPLGDDFPCCAPRSMSDTPNGSQGRTIAHQSNRSNT